jgi:hypothetical protein
VFLLDRAVLFLEVFRKTEALLFLSRFFLIWFGPKRKDSVFMVHNGNDHCLFNLKKKGNLFPRDKSAETCVRTVGILSRQFSFIFL